MKRVVIIHTSFVSHALLTRLFGELCPDVALTNIVDDSLLAEVSQNGHVTEGVQERMNAYVKQAASLAPSLILNQCSSVSEAFTKAAAGLTIPTLRIDAPMAYEVAELCPDGGRIAVVATVSSTMGPSTRLAEEAVRASGKKIEVRPVLIDGALDILMKDGNRQKHDALVTERIEEACKTCDVIVLAQGSMFEIGEQLQSMPKPVLSSPRRAVLRIKETLA